MGYFSNGSEGLDYQERYCFHCLHWSDEKGCPVWNLHQIHNYKECNKADSFLHAFIPRSEDHFRNEQCEMFVRQIASSNPAALRPCSDGHCGAEDCPRCHPANFWPGGRYFDGEPRCKMCGETMNECGCEREEVGHVEEEP